MDTHVDVTSLMQTMGRNARQASAVLACASSDRKNVALRAAAEALMDDRAALLAANTCELHRAREKGPSPAMLDRLALDDGRIAAMADGLRAIADQTDPVGAVIAEATQPSGLHIRRVRTPIGVIGMIYESRPNVTADAGALCLKAGNAVILRGGSESIRSANKIHAALVSRVSAPAGLPEHAIQLVPTTDRAGVGAMLGMTEFIDVIVPRGGEVSWLGASGSQVPGIRPILRHRAHLCRCSRGHGQGPPGDPERQNSRTGICGAAECLLI